jgi:hypothetical protein
MSGGRDWVETLDLTTIILYIARIGDSSCVFGKVRHEAFGEC